MTERGTRSKKSKQQSTADKSRPAPVAAEASYTIQFSKRALRDLKGIDKKEASKILDKIKGLAKSPTTAANVTPLKGSDHFRLRVGDYRVIFGIDGESLVIDVIRVGHRREIYR